MPRRKKFKLVTLGRDSHPEMTDIKGKVRVVVRAVASNGSFLRGNVTRTITFRDTTVSELADAIRERLTQHAQ